MEVTAKMLKMGIIELTDEEMQEMLDRVAKLKAKMTRKL